MKEHDNLSNTRCAWVDCIKGIAIYAVFLSHSSFFNSVYPISIIGNIGRHGVQIFCIVSSYLCMLSYKRYCECETGRRLPLKWWRKKILHLLPLYYVGIVFAVISGQYKYWYTGNEGVSIKSIILHVFLLHGFSPEYYNSIIRVEWYIGALVIFYLIFPILYKMINSLEKSFLWLIISGFLCDLMIHIITHLDIIENSENYTGYWSEFSIIAQFPSFLGGIVLYFILQSGILDHIKQKRVFSISIYIFILGMIFGIIMGKTSVYGFTQSTLYSFVFLLLIPVITLSESRVLVNPFFAWGGRNSYAIYLFHFSIIMICNTYIVKGESSLAEHVERFVLSVFLTVLFVIVLNGLKKFFQRHRGTTL